MAQLRKGSRAHARTRWAGAAGCRWLGAALPLLAATAALVGHAAMEELLVLVRSLVVHSLLRFRCWPLEALSLVLGALCRWSSSLSSWLGLRCRAAADAVSAGLHSLLFVVHVPLFFRCKLLDALALVLGALRCGCSSLSSLLRFRCWAAGHAVAAAGCFAGAGCAVLVAVLLLAAVAAAGLGLLRCLRDRCELRKRGGTCGGRHCADFTQWPHIAMMHGGATL